MTTSSKPQALRRISVAELFSSELSFATSLLLGAVDHLGPECLEWLPDTVAIEMASDFNITVEDEAISKLRAAWKLLQTDGFYQRTTEFVDVTGGLNGAVLWGIPTVAEMAWAVVEAAVIAPSPHEERAFSFEVAAYIREASKIYGYTKLPGVLEEAASASAPAEDPVGFLADDPVLYGAVSQIQTADKAQIERVLWWETSRLINQLSRLDLKEPGKLPEYVKAVSEQLPKTPAGRA